MLVVVTDIERETIDRAVVAEGLLVGIHRVMLLDPAGTDRMQPDRKEERKEQITESGPPAEIHDRHTERDGAEQIDEDPAVPHRDRP